MVGAAVLLASAWLAAIPALAGGWGWGAGPDRAEYLGEQRQARYQAGLDCFQSAALVESQRMLANQQSLSRTLTPPVPLSRLRPMYHVPGPVPYGPMVMPPSMPMRWP